MQNRKMASEIPDLLSESEAAEILGKAPITLWRERKRGKISFRKMGKDVMYTPGDLAEYIERSKQPAVMAVAA